MRNRLTVIILLGLLVAGGCAPVPPERAGREASEGRAVGTPPREVRAPMLAPGDRWQLRWQDSTGSGTFEVLVEGEELVDGVAHYVVSMGTTRFYYVKETLAFHLRKDGEVVVGRLAPPDGYAWPLRIGKQWESSYRNEDVRSGRRQDFYRKCIVADAPTITVPAGSFETLHVVCRDRENRLVSETWYSEVAKFPVQRREPTERGSRVTELVEYSVRRRP